MTPRILQVVLSLNPGGTERLVIDLVSRLNREMPMMVCCLDEPGAWSAQLESIGIRVVGLGRQPGFHPGLGRAVARVAHAHRATAIHAHHYSPFVYSAIARAWHPKVAVLFTEHGRLSDAPPSAKRRLANRALGFMPRRVFAVSKDVKAHLVAEGFNAAAVDVIYNGIDGGALPGPSERAHVRAALGVDDRAIVVTTIARLDPVKDLATLLRAAALARHTYPVVLVIVGDGPERASLETLAAGLGIADAVRFLGHRDDARLWLGGSDVYANSSTSEGVSLTILEGMAAALPVVATRVGGTPEVIDDSCGRLVPARDPEALASTIAALAAASGERDRLGKAARRRVDERFLLDRMVREYADVYRHAGARVGGSRAERAASALT